MSTRTGETIEYKCFNDCRMEGCPGHTVTFQHLLTSDLYMFIFNTAGVEDHRECFDENRWHAMEKAINRKQGGMKSDNEISQGVARDIREIQDAIASMRDPPFTPIKLGSGADTPSLRDKFSMAAMAGLVTRSEFMTEVDPACDAETLSMICYQIADAMMEARKK